MIKRIRFPKFNDQRYYKTHYRFFVHLAQAAGIEVELYDSRWYERGFVVEYSNVRAHVDYGDHGEVVENPRRFQLSFRYHFLKQHQGLEACYPFTPISFYGWAEYWRMSRVIHYTAESDVILNNQIPGARALERRRAIQALLKKTYGKDADFAITNREEFWSKAANCLVSVCVPGARNDILDRGQIQYMALGACTISPPLDITLPYWRSPTPGVHYVACKPDYSDLIEQIEWCRQNRRHCVEVGRAAQALFQDTCAPQKVWAWVNKCTEGSL